MKVFLVLLALIVATSGRAVKSESEEESNILDLTDETYKSTIKHTKGRVFVRFYSGMCSICRAFLPKWEDIADKLKGKVLIADLDCMSYNSVCHKFKIRHYPTFFLFEDGKPRIEVNQVVNTKKLLKLAAKQYKDDESDEDFEPLKDSTEEVKKKSKRRSKRSAPTVTAIEEIFGSNFKTATLGKVTLVSFCVPWCESCQKIMSTMLELRRQLKETDVKLARIDCNNKLNSDICFSELVNGVPMINLYCNGDLRVKDFTGSTFEELKDLISSNCGDATIASKWKSRYEERKHNHHQHNQ